MPFIQVKTNVSISDTAESLMKMQLGQAIAALPGKSESWLMAAFEGEARLWFQGTDAPAAMVEVSVYGGAPDDAYNDLTARLCDIVNSALDIPLERIYVKYAETPNWGWNGANF